MAVAGWANRDLVIKIGSTFLRVPPKAAPSEAPGSASPKPLSGDAPWALSVFPECLTQTSRTTGHRAFVLAHLPSGATQVASGSTLTYADCTISVRGDEAWIRRGSDWFHIPPPVRLYRSPGALALVSGDPNAMEMRVYAPANQ